MTSRDPSPSALGLDLQTSAALSRADHHARAYLSALDSAPVATTAARAALLTQLDVPLGVEGLPADRVVDELAAAVEGGLIGSAGRSGWDVAVDGMAGAPPLRVFATAMHHVSLDRALRDPPGCTWTGRSVSSPGPADVSTR